MNYPDYLKWKPAGVALAKPERMRLKASLVVLTSWIFLAAAAFDLSDAFLSQVEAEHGASARKRLESWERLMNVPQELPEERKLKLVNAFFNQARFRSDLEHWGQEDFWATPVEMLISNGGDCEDYSIAKYFTLIQLGVPAERLLITYVKALELNQAHMVLAYYASPESDPLILDNLIGDIKPASQRQDLYPVYSFNGEGLWLAKQRGLGKRVGESSKLSQWQALRDRLKTQIGSAF